MLGAKVGTRPLKDSPLSLPAENFNFPQESQVAQHACVLHPALWVDAEGKLAPTVQVSKMVSMRPPVNHGSLRTFSKQTVQLQYSPGAFRIIVVPQNL